MAVLSKLLRFRTLAKKSQTTTLSQCDKIPGLKLDGLRVKAKLLLPMVVIPDDKPALNLFKAGVCGKKKGKPVAILNFAQKCMFTTTKNQEDFIKNCTTITKFWYENIVSVEVTSQKREVAIVYQRPEDGTFLCICVKVKSAKEYGDDGKFSKSRNITGKEIQQLLKPVLTVTAPSSSLTSDKSSISEASLSSIPHFSEPVSSNESNESLTSIKAEETKFNDSCLVEIEREDQHIPEWIRNISANSTVQEPSTEDKAPEKRCLSIEETLKNVMELTDPRPNKSSPQYHEQPKGYLEIFQQPSAFTPYASSTSYYYEGQQSNALSNYQNAYMAYLWQLRYMSQLHSGTMGPSTSSTTQSTYSSQAGSFEPSVSYLYSCCEQTMSSSDSPAFCLVNGHYQTSPHISFVDPITTIPRNPQSPLDIEAIEADC